MLKIVTLIFTILSVFSITCSELNVEDHVKEIEKDLKQWKHKLAKLNFNSQIRQYDTTSNDYEDEKLFGMLSEIME